MNLSDIEGLTIKFLKIVISLTEIPMRPGTKIAPKKPMQ